MWAHGVAELPETKAGKKQYLPRGRAALAILEAARTAGILDLRQQGVCAEHALAIPRLRGGANLVTVSGLLRHASPVEPYYSSGSRIVGRPRSASVRTQRRSRLHVP